MKIQASNCIPIYNNNFFGRYGGMFLYLIEKNPGISQSVLYRLFPNLSKSNVSYIMQMLERHDLIAGTLSAKVIQQLPGVATAQNIGVSHIPADPIDRFVGKKGKSDAVREMVEGWEIFKRGDVTPESQAALLGDSDVASVFGGRLDGKFAPPQRRYYAIPEESEIYPFRYVNPWTDTDAWFKCMSDPVHYHLSPLTKERRFSPKAVKNKRPFNPPVKQAIKNEVWRVVHEKWGRNKKFTEQFAFYTVLCSSLQSIDQHNVIEKWFEDWMDMEMDAVKTSNEVKMFHFMSGGYTKLELLA